MKLFKIFIINLLFISFMTSCSENNSSTELADTKLTNENQTGEFTVTGVAAKGPLLNATIEAYAFDANGVATGASLSTTTTDANGNWSLSFATAPTEPLLITSSGGSFIDESDTNPDISLKRRITLGSTDSLQGVLFPQFNSASITLLSHSLLQKCRVEMLSGGQDFVSLLEKNRNLAKSAIGFDPFVVASTDPLSPSTSASEESIQYAMYLGGMANVLNTVAIMMGQPVPDYAMMMGLVQDLSDGKLNGLDVNGAVMVDINGTPTAMPNNLDMNQTINRFVNNNFIAYQNINVNRPAVDENILSQPATNKTPVAINDAFTAAPDAAFITGNVLANDADPDGDTIAVSAFTQPANGAVVNNGNATFTYTPNSGFTGSDQFSYTISDGKGASATANIVIEVAQGGGNTNVAPVVNAGNDQSVNEQSSISLSGSASDSDGSIASYNWQQVNGTPVSISDASLASASFTSPVVLTGSIEVLVFELMATDNQGATNTDYVTVVVNPVNPPPVANAGVDQTVNEGLLVTLDGTASTDDRPGFTYSWAQVAGGSTGTVVSLSGATTANPSFTIPDIINNETITFELTIMDDEGSSSTDQVNINLVSLNAGPTLTDDSGYTLNEDTPIIITDLVANDTDPEGNAISITSVSGAVNGVVVLSAANEVTFTPALNVNGSASFTYTAQDSFGTLSTNSATVSLTIAAVNDNPVAVADSASMIQGTEITISDMLLNDTDVENTTLVLTGVNGTGSQGGKVVNNGDGSITFIPLPGFSGTEDVTYVISDGQGGSASGIISVLVNADADGDSITDADELLANPSVTDPNLADSDSDGFYDQHELAAGTDPNDLNSFPIPTVISSAQSTISVDTIWTLANSPYWVQANLVIQSGATLTIESGVVVKIDDVINVDVKAGGILNALGENPLPQRIIFTSSRDDSINADTNGDANATSPSAGNWQGVQFFGASNGRLNGVNIYYGSSCLIVEDASAVFRYMDIGDCNIYGVRYQTSGSSTNNANFSNIKIVDVDGNNRSTTNHGMYFNSTNSSTMQLNVSNISVDKAGSNTFYNSVYIRSTGGNIRGTVDQLTVTNAKGTGLYVYHNANSGVIDASLSNLTISGTPREAVYFNQNTVGAYVVPTIDGTNTISGTNANYASIRVENAHPIFATTGSTSVTGGWSGLSLGTGATGSYENIAIDGSNVAAISLSSNSLPTNFANINVTGTTTPFNIGGQSLPANVFAGTSIASAPDMSIRYSGTVVADAVLGADPLGTGTSVWNIAGTVTVNAGVVLTVTDNAILKFDPNIIMYVYGTLDVVSTPSNEAIFTSIKDDVLSDTNGDGTISLPAANDWAYIQHFSGSTINLNNAIIRFASYGLYSSSATLNININNSVFDTLYNYGIYAFDVGVSSIAISNTSILNVGFNDGIYINEDSGDVLTLNIDGLTIDNIGNDSNDNGMDILVSVDASLTGTWQNMTLSNIAGNGLYINDTSTGLVDPLLSAITVNPTIAGSGIRIIGDATTTPTIDASANSGTGTNRINSGSYGIALTGVGGSYSDIEIDGSGAAAIYLSGNVNPGIWNDASIVISNVGSPYRLLTSLPASIGVLGTADLGYTIGVAGGVNLEFLGLSGTLSDTNLVADPLNTGTSVYYATGNLTVPAGVILNLANNAVLKMAPSSYIYVRGTLSSSSSGGTSFITSINDDSVGGDTNLDGTTTAGVAGDWGYIQTYGTSVVNLLNTSITYAQYGLYSAYESLDYTLDNVLLSNMSSYGLYAYSMGVSNISINNSSITKVATNDGVYLYADTGDVVTLNINGLTIDTIGNDNADRGMDLLINNDASLTGNWLDISISNTLGGGVYVTDTSTGTVNPTIGSLSVTNYGVGTLGLYFSGDPTTTIPTVNNTGTVGTNNFISGGYGLGVYGAGGSYANIAIDIMNNGGIVVTNNANPGSWDDASIFIDNSPTPYLLRTELPASIGVLGTIDLGYSAGTGLVENYINITGTLDNLSLISDPLNNGRSVYYSSGNITVPAGVTLNLEDNAVLKMEANTYLYLTGTLSSNSTATNEAIITSFVDDVVSDSNADNTQTAPAPNDWGYIQMNNGSLVNLNNAIVRYSNYGLYSSSGAVDVTVNNSVFTQMNTSAYSSSYLGTSSITFTNSTISKITTNDGFYMFAGSSDVVTLNLDNLIIDTIGNDTSDHGIELSSYSDAIVTGSLTNLTISNIAGNGISIFDSGTGLVDPRLSQIVINPSIGANGIRIVGNGDGTTVPTIDNSVGANVITGVTNYGLAISNTAGSYSDITIDGAGLSSLYFSDNAQPSTVSNIVLTNSPSPYTLMNQGLPANFSNASFTDDGSAIENYVRIYGTFTTDVTLVADPLASTDSYWRVVADLRTGANALSIDANTLMKFDTSTYLYVDAGGSLNVNGSLGNEVVMTSVTDDSVGTPAASGAATNDWNGLRFETNSNGGTINYLSTYFARFGTLIYDVAVSPDFNNLFVSYANEGVYLSSGATDIFPTFTNLKIEEPVSYAIRLTGTSAMAPVFTGSLEITDVLNTYANSCIYNQSSSTNINITGWTISGCYNGLNLSASSAGNYTNNLIRQAATRGVYINSDQPLLLADNKIVNNGGAADGVGIYVNSAANSTLIQNNIIRDNVSTGSGGGIYVNLTTGALTIRNNLIIENAAGSTTLPGGVYIYANSTVELLNNTIVDNYAGGSTNPGVGLSIGATNNVVSYHDNIIFNNTDTDSVSEVSDLASSTAFNNLLADPTFEQGWYLNTGGVGAIDAGSDTAANLNVSGTTQADGSADLNLADLGYHYNAGVALVDANNSTAVLSNATTTINTTETITITPLDAGSLPIGAAMNVSVSANSPEYLGRMIDHGDGVYTITYTPTTLSGSDTLTITANGVVLSTTLSISWQ